MAVRASYVALINLFLNPFDARGAVDEFTEFQCFDSPHVVKFEHHRVVLAAIDTGASDEIVVDILKILPCAFAPPELTLGLREIVQ